MTEVYTAVVSAEGRAGDSSIMLGFFGAESIRAATPPGAYG